MLSVPLWAIKKLNEYPIGFLALIGLVLVLIEI